jgi:hypothetical protein
MEVAIVFIHSLHKLFNAEVMYIRQHISPPKIIEIFTNFLFGLLGDIRSGRAGKLL